MKAPSVVRLSSVKYIDPKFLTLSCNTLEGLGLVGPSCTMTDCLLAGLLVLIVKVVVKGTRLRILRGVSVASTTVKLVETDW